MLAAKAMSNFDRQSFTAEDVDHGQHPELLTIAELVMDEVETPRLVRLNGLATRRPVHEHLAPAR